MSTPKEKGIIFSSDMVRAILENRKSQTRRVVKPQPVYRDDFDGGWVVHNKKAITSIEAINERRVDGFCPYGKVGDRLWVRETWSTYMTSTEHFEKDKRCVWYKNNAKKVENNYGFKWKPSIHMPRWASRIALEITDIRVEKLQEISVEDIWKEGIYKLKPAPPSQRTYYLIEFKRLWDSLHKKEYRWEKNLWVWVISFKRVKTEKG